MKRSVVLAFGFFLLVSSSLSKAPSDLNQKIYEVLREPALRNARVGIRVELLGSRKEIFSYNASLPLIPASNLKLVTSACALRKLGSDFRFVTKVLGSPIQNGRASGDLVLRGSGDPTWNKDFYPRSTTPLVILAQRLRESGLREVAGDLVVDDSAFDRQFVGKGWKSRYQWEDYATEVGALSINNNEVKVSVLPGTVGRPPRVVLSPPNHVLRVANRAWTSRGRSALRYARNRLKNFVILSGSISRYSEGVSFPFNIHNPPLFVGSVFREILKAEGIRVHGKVRLVQSYEVGKFGGLIPLVELQSPPLLAMVRRLNKESDNFLSEHLFRALGASQTGKGSLQNSFHAALRCLDELGIGGVGLNMADGSGLSDLNRVSVATLVNLLQGMAVLPVGIDFKATLPEGGVDGTLEDRLADVTVQAKTGAIRGVSALSGYLVTDQGQTLVFSIITNHFSVSNESARRAIDHLVRIFAQYRELVSL